MFFHESIFQPRYLNCFKIFSDLQLCFTQDTVGSLYKIIPYPSYNPAKGNYVTWQNKYDYIAINKRSQFVTFSHQDLALCEKTQHIVQCGKQEVQWQDRRTKVCEAEVIYCWKTVLFSISFPMPILGLL